MLSRPDRGTTEQELKLFATLAEVRPIFRDRLEVQIPRILSSLDITLAELNKLYDCGQAHHVHGSENR